MKLLTLLLLCAALMPAESKSEKQLRTQLAEAQDQIRKEQALSVQEKQSASQANAVLSRSYAALQKQTRDLSARLDAVTAERDAIRLQFQLHQKNDNSISAFQAKVLAAKPVEAAATVAREVPKIERKLDTLHQANTEALNRNATAVKNDMDRIERKVDAATGIARRSEAGTEKNERQLEHHDASIEWIRAWGVFNSCLLTIVIGLNLFSYWKK